MQSSSSGCDTAKRVLRIAVPVTLLLSVIVAGFSGATALDLSVRGGYFKSGAPLPIVFFSLITLCGGTALAHALLTVRKDAKPIAYFTLPSFFALLPILGIIVCAVDLIRPFSPTPQTIVSLVSLCSGLLYFSTFFCAGSIQKTYRFIAGLVFMVWPIISFIYSFIDWYVPLNSPSKLLYQFSLLALAFFICEELRATSGALNGRTLLLSAVFCSIMCATTAVFLLAGKVTYPVAGGNGSVCLLLSVTVYASARWHVYSSDKYATDGACPEDIQVSSTSSSQETEDESHAG